MKYNNENRDEDEKIEIPGNITNKTKQIAKPIKKGKAKEVIKTSKWSFVYINLTKNYNVNYISFKINVEISSNYRRVYLACSRTSKKELIVICPLSLIINKYFQLHQIIIRLKSKVLLFHFSNCCSELPFYSNLSRIIRHLTWWYLINLSVYHSLLT